MALAVRQLRRFRYQLKQMLDKKARSDMSLGVQYSFISCLAFECPQTIRRTTILHYFAIELLRHAEWALQYFMFLCGPDWNAVRTIPMSTQVGQQ